MGHILCFIPMLWLGYAGMPRRVQDYPYGYSGWHSVASLGHTLVLMGLVSFVLALGHAAYFKRPLLARHLGAPFIVARSLFLVLDRQYGSRAYFGRQLIGVRVIRDYLVVYIG